MEKDTRTFNTTMDDIVRMTQQRPSQPNQYAFGAITSVRRKKNGN